MYVFAFAGFDVNFGSYDAAIVMISSAIFCGSIFMRGGPFPPGGCHALYALGAPFLPAAAGKWLEDEELDANGGGRTPLFETAGAEGPVVTVSKT